MPQINLPSFSRNFTAWLSFIDQFRSTVHDNDKLSPVIIMMYLTSCLTIHASKPNRNLKTTESNYEIALQRLQQKYENVQTFVTNWRFHCSSNRECVSAPSATLSFQWDFTVHQGTQMVSRNQFVAFLSLRESRSWISECIKTATRVRSLYVDLIPQSISQSMRSRCSLQERTDLMRMASRYPSVNLEPAESDTQFGNVRNTDRWQHLKKRNSWPIIGYASIIRLPATSSSNVLRHHCERHVKSSTIHFFMVLLVSAVLISQRQ